MLTALTGYVGNGGICANVDSSIAQFFRAHLSPQFADVLWWVTGAGCEVWVTTIIVLSLVWLGWKRKWMGMAMVLLTVPCGTLMGEVLKHAVQRQRPFASGPFGDWGGYSFPSGHTLAATLLYGMVALAIAAKVRDRFWRAFLIAIAGVLIVSVAFSRVALGAHYASDVMGAMIFGGVWLMVCAKMVERLKQRRLGRAVEELPVVQKMAA